MDHLLPGGRAGDAQFSVASFDRLFLIQWTSRCESFSYHFLPPVSHAVHQQILPACVWKYVCIQAHTQQLHHCHSASSTSLRVFPDHGMNRPGLRTVILSPQLSEHSLSKKVRSWPSTADGLCLSVSLRGKPLGCPKAPRGWSWSLRPYHLCSPELATTAVALRS